MEFSASFQQFDIFDIYRRFRDIKLGNAYPGKEENTLNDDFEKMKLSREALAQLSKTIDSSWNMRLSILDELRKLMACLNTMGDFSEFSNFYDFVFFVCRENSQKNITVSRAIACWKFVLAGRFRLLNQWCDFVEKNQRYNISEDTWRQVLAFSRCVHEDLEGYDPEGAWPILIDDFVEHMYRITGSNDCSSHSLTCRCGDPEGQSSIFEETLPGLKEMPGLKRKFREELQGVGLSVYSSPTSDAINSVAHCKRQRQQRQRLLARTRDSSLANASCEESQTIKLNGPLHSSKSPCAVEGCLSKGFSGLFSSYRVQN